jgi:transcriptional regulator with XRE-family HTH domain
MTSIRKILAANMREYRGKLCLSQAKLAERVDTATHYISMIESCKKFPSAEMIERIANALEVDSLDMFALTPIHKDWQKDVLSELEKIMTEKLNSFEQARKTSPSNPKWDLG